MAVPDTIVVKLSGFFGVWATEEVFGVWAIEEDFGMEKTFANFMGILLA